MPKIITEVPDGNCIGCRHLTDNSYGEYCNLFNRVLHDYKHCPLCIASEVNNLFNKHLENVLKEEKEK